MQVHSLSIHLVKSSSFIVTSCQWANLGLKLLCPNIWSVPFCPMSASGFLNYSASIHHPGPSASIHDPPVVWGPRQLKATFEDRCGGANFRWSSRESYRLWTIHWWAGHCQILRVQLHHGFTTLKEISKSLKISGCGPAFSALRIPRIVFKGLDKIGQ